MRLRKQIVGQHIHKRNVLCLTERRMARPPQVWGQFSRSVVSDPLWPQGLQHARPPCPSPTPRACSNYCPLSWWYHPTISSSVISFSSCPQSFPYQGLFKWVSFSHQVVKVLEFHLQHQSFQWTPRTDFPWDGLVGSPCSPRDSQVLSKGLSVWGYCEVKAYLFLCRSSCLTKSLSISLCPHSSLMGCGR